MSNKSNKKNTAKRPAAKKGAVQMRNKRAAAAAQKKNAQKAAVAVKPAMPREQKIFVVLVALLCVFSITFVSLGTVYLVDLLDNVKYGSIYDDIRLKDYVGRIEKTDYMGKDIDLTSYYQKPYELADMDDYLYDLRFANRKSVAYAQKTTPIGFGDDIAYFIVEILNENGEAVLKEDFSAANYQSALTMTIGREQYGDDFEEKLIALGLKPADTERRIRYNGGIALGDTVALTLTAHNVETYYADHDKCVWKTDKSMALTSSRVELAEYEQTLAAAVVSGCKEVGEPFEFILENYDVNKNGTIETAEKAVKFEACVDFAVVKEQTADVTFTLPEDYFDSERDGTAYPEDYLALNGKTVTFRLIVTSMDDYDVPALDADFIKNTLKFETDKTSNEEVIAAYKQHALEELNAELAEGLDTTYRSAVISMLVEPLYQRGVFGNNDVDAEAKYPDALIQDAYSAASKEMQNLYASSGYSASMDYETFVVQYVSSMTGQQASSLSSALSYVAEQRICQELFLYWVFDKQNIKIKKDVLEQAYNEYLDELVEGSSNPDTYNREYWINYYGEDELYSKARRGLVYDLTADFLIANNNVKYGS